MGNKLEYRRFNTEFRVSPDKPVVEGYAATFNSPTEIYPWFRESIAPGCFERAIREKQDVRCLFNHEASAVLGRTKSGSLRLAEDSHGLHFECDLNENDPMAMGVRAKIMRGDVDQCSFGFYCVKEDVQYNDDDTIDRVLEDVDLFDVSPVTYPAYESTSCEARSLEDAKKTADAHRKLHEGQFLSKDEIETLLLRTRVMLRDAEDRDDLCECDCPECLAGDCEDCSNPNCDDPNCEGS